jgi:O-antigen/teichoic acid export membrane protein
MGRVYAQVFSFCMFGVIGFFLFVKRRYLKWPDVRFWKRMLMWSVPLIPHLATSFIRQGCDRFIINGFHSIEQVGLFSFALNMATITTMIGMGFNQSNSVDIYKILGDKEIDNDSKIHMLKKQRTPLSIIYLVVAVLVLLICYFFIPIILPKYADSMFYIPLLSVYALFCCYYFLYTNYLFYYEKTKNIMYVTLGAALVHLALSYFLTRYSLLVTCMIYCVTQYFVYLCIKKMALRELKLHLTANS